MDSLLGQLLEKFYSLPQDTQDQVHDVAPPVKEEKVKPPASLRSTLSDGARIMKRTSAAKNRWGEIREYRMELGSSAYIPAPH